jgi:hypothetical protein
MIMNGDYDVVLTQPENDWWFVFDKLNTPKYQLIIKNSHHFSFGDSICEDYDVIGQCQNGDERIFAIDQYSLAFFKYYLKKDSTALTRLTETLSILADHRWEQ